MFATVECRRPFSAIAAVLIAIITTLLVPYEVHAAFVSGSWNYEPETYVIRDEDGEPPVESDAGFRIESALLISFSGQLPRNGSKGPERLWNYQKGRQR